MKRQESTAVTKRNSLVVERIKELKADHPFWGHRRIWAHLKYIDGLEANRKRILRLMQRYRLVVKPNTRLKAVRTSGRSKPRPTRPYEWWGIDMTKVMVEGFGWMYIVVALDWYTKRIVGYYAGVQSQSKHWLEALDGAVNGEFPDGVEMGVKQAFTSYGNPKGNADTERVFRTMKEELLWLREWHSPFELTDALGKWIESYNRSYLHSTLGYKSPMKFQEEYQNNQLTLLVTA